MWPRRLDRLLERTNDLLPGVEAGQRPSGSRRWSCRSRSCSRRRADPCSSSIFITAGMPPTLCRSSMTYLPTGLEIREERHAIADLLEVVDGQRHVRPRGPWRSDAARRWSSRRATMTITMAFSNAARVMMSRGLRSSSSSVRMRGAGAHGIRPACRDRRPGWRSCRAAIMPIASMAEAMVLAVYMPPQAPAPGQEWSHDVLARPPR